MSGSLGLGYNASDQSSSTIANSSGYGYSGTNSGDVSRSGSSSLSGGSSVSGQDIAFKDLFSQLYGNATDAAGNVAAQAPELQGAARQLFTGGTQFLQSLGGNAGTDYQESRLNGTNPDVENLIASMKTDASDLFSNNLNPAITSRAVAGGTLGGGRQGVAQGVAQAQVANDFTRNAAQIRLADVNQKDAIAANIAGNSISAAGTGLGSLPGLLDVFERGQNAELAPYSSLASILGGPTTLSSSEASNFGESTAQSSSDAFSRSFGEQSTSSSSISKSKGKGRGYTYQGSYSEGPSGGG